MFRCDCKLDWLYQQWVPRIPKLGSSTQCYGPANMAGLPISDMHKHHMQCGNFIIIITLRRDRFCPGNSVENRTAGLGIEPRPAGVSRLTVDCSDRRATRDPTTDQWRSRNQIQVKRLKFIYFVISAPGGTLFDSIFFFFFS